MRAASRTLGVPAALWAVGAMLLACGGGPRPDVIVISIDTLRRDAVGALGAAADATPHLDAFLATAVVFERAHALEPHTLPSHVSLFTGLHPLSHGVAARMRGTALARDVPTLAERLGAAGYRTAAFVNGGFLHPRYGVARGFQTYDYVSDVAHRSPRAPTRRFGRNAAQTNRTVFRWLDRVASRPVFLFVHYFDVHSDWRELPYESPPRYLARYVGVDERDVLPHSGATASGFLLAANRSGRTLPDLQLETLRHLYAAGVRYTDDRFGDLVAGLRARGLWDDALVVVLSDHGEEFQEHGRLLHTQLYRECVDVLLAIKPPEAAGVPPRRRRELVDLTDVAPTVLEAVGEPVPEDMQGRSLLPLMRARAGGNASPRAWRRRPVVLYSSLTGALALRTREYQLVVPAPDAAPELYALADDPLETHDLAEAEPEVVATALARLERSRERLESERGAHAQPAKPLDPAAAERLRALGYTR